MAWIGEVAAHLFCSATRIKQLIDAGTIVRQPPGAYDLDICRKAVLDQLRATAAARGTGTHLADELALLSRRQRELVELKTAKLRGAVVEIEIVGEIVEERFAIIKERLLALPSVASDRCAGLDRNAIFAILRDHMIEVLNELYEPARIIAEAGGNPEEDGNAGRAPGSVPPAEGQ
jgi:hypothetical protein